MGLHSKGERNKHRCLEYEYLCADWRHIEAIHRREYECDGQLHEYHLQALLQGASHSGAAIMTPTQKALQKGRDASEKYRGVSVTLRVNGQPTGPVLTA